MCAANQRRSRCWRKTSARHDETRPTPPLLSIPTRKARLFRVQILTIRLDRLHLALQAAMGWTNSHLYEIRARDVGRGMPDPDWGEGPLDARKTRLLDVLEDTGAKTLKYLYDFGDG